MFFFYFRDRHTFPNARRVVLNIFRRYFDLFSSKLNDEENIEEHAKYIFVDPLYFALHLLYFRYDNFKILEKERSQRDEYYSHRVVREYSISSSRRMVRTVLKDKK